MIDWLATLKVAAEVAGSTKSLVGVVGDIYHWFESLIRPSNDQQAQKVWEDFKRNPEANVEALAKVARQLKPDKDPVLTGYVLGMARQKLQADRRRIYTLLTGSRYTFEQVDYICARLDPNLTGLERPHTQQRAAQWAVNLAATRQEIGDELISAMLETNPEVIAEVVKLG